jgi:hypothetical protein
MDFGDFWPRQGWIQPRKRRTGQNTLSRSSISLGFEQDVQVIPYSCIKAILWPLRVGDPQGSGHGVYSAVALSRLACMFVAGGVVFVPIVRYN